MQEKYKKNMSFRVRMMANQYLLFGESSAYQLNDTGNKIWNELDENKNIDDIITSLKLQYHSIPEYLESDIQEFIDFLIEINAIQVVS